MTPRGVGRTLAGLLALGAAWVWFEASMYDRRYQRRYGPLDGRDADEQLGAVYITDWWRAMKAREAEVIRIWAARESATPPAA